MTIFRISPPQRRRSRLPFPWWAFSAAFADIKDYEFQLVQPTSSKAMEPRRRAAR